MLHSQNQRAVHLVGNRTAARMGASADFPTGEDDLPTEAREHSAVTALRARHGRGLRDCHTFAEAWSRDEHPPSVRGDRG